MQRHQLNEYFHFVLLLHRGVGLSNKERQNKSLVF